MDHAIARAHDLLLRGGAAGARAVLLDLIAHVDLGASVSKAHVFELCTLCASMLHEADAATVARAARLLAPLAATMRMPCPSSLRIAA